MSRFFIPATKPEDWRSLLADPDLHWKKGYSAMNLAYCWQAANGFPNSVKKVFNESEIMIFHGIELLMAFPEYKVPLPGGVAASQNDLFVLGKCEDQLICIMVEGKSSEGFGTLVSEWFADPSPGRKERLDYLCGMLGLEINDVMGIRYQLLHRTVSALIEAERFNTKNALMLVHSFSESNDGFDDFSKFASMFGIKAGINKIQTAGNISGINLYLSWVKDTKKYGQTESG
jgi:hypothetical protein